MKISWLFLFLLGSSLNLGAMNFPPRRVVKQVPRLNLTNQSVPRQKPAAQVIAPHVLSEEQLRAHQEREYAREQARLRIKIEEALKDRYGILPAATENINTLIVSAIDGSHTELDSLIKFIYTPREGNLRPLLNAKNQKGETPLMIAASLGDIRKCDLLMRHGADCNGYNWECDWTVLSYALSNGLQGTGDENDVVSLARFFIERGARIELDAFMQAAHQSPRIFALLIAEYLSVPEVKSPHNALINASKLENLRKLMKHAQQRVWYRTLLDELTPACADRDVVEDDTVAYYKDQHGFEQSVRVFLGKHHVVNGLKKK